MTWRTGTRVFFVFVLFLTAGAAIAQPAGGFLTVSSGHGYIQLPSNAALNFDGQSFTFEAWISTSADSCRTLAGNGWTVSQWIGNCGGTLRSYLSGSASRYDAGTIPANDWTHVAVTFDAATGIRRHYVDGELAGETSTAAITSSPTAWRIWSDVSWEFTPNGAVDELRFWNVARTQAQIRENITKSLTSAQTGLVAVYALDGNANATVGGAALNGTRTGEGGFLTNPVGSGCTTSATQLCVGPSGRFSISATYNTPSTSGNVAQVVTALTTPESGLFWFFGANNWEVMVKLLNGCAINNRKWVFSSATTDQHFELVVTDITHGVTKRYFNYAGAPAPAIIDVDAFATCP